jgi:hypothetical protein
MTFFYEKGPQSQYFTNSMTNDSDENESPTSDDLRARLTAAASHYGIITSARNSSMVELSPELANAMELKDRHRILEFTRGR